MKQAFSRLSIICLSTLSYLCATGKISLAQVVPDNTVNTQVNQNGSVAEITGGETRGGNLFHSFQNFSVPTGNEAFFDNPDSISNIFSRVTGGSVSNIDGAIRANGSANLFLINPAGIVFGKNASLNIGGSFFGSTASNILFPDGEFSAIAPESESVLTVDVPIGLGFGDNPGDITVRGDGSGTNVEGDLVAPENALRVNSDSTIGLVGGQLNFEGTSIRADGGRIELGSVAGNERVSFNPANEGLSLGYNTVTNFNDIFLSQNAAVGSSGLVSGNVRVWGNNINFLEGSRIYARTVANSVTDLTPGSVEINANNAISFEGENLRGFGSSISNTVRSGAIGDAGDVTVVTNSLSLDDGGSIFTNTSGKGDAGSLNVIASDTITINGQNSQSFPSVIGSTVGPEALGNAGNITVDTGSLFLTNGGIVDTNTSGRGNAGSVNIVAGDTITIDGENSQGFSGFVSSRVSLQGVGNAGDIDIASDSLSLINGGQINAATFGRGDGGAINITAKDKTTIEGTSSRGVPSAVGSTVEPKAAGNAGDITIDTASLSLTDGGEVNTSTVGKGNAGLIGINATDTITIDGGNNLFPSAVLSQVVPGAVGDSGGVNIDTASLNLTDGGQVSASTGGEGNAGSIDITAENTIRIDGENSRGATSSVNSGISFDALGDSEGVTIDTGSILLNNGGQISASTFGEGNAGSIDIIAKDTVAIDGEDSRGLPSGLESVVRMQALGDSEGITIDTGSLSITNGARINTNTFGKGNAGSISILASDSISIDGESLQSFPSAVASTIQPGASGDAGGITVDTNSLFLTGGGQVNASTLGLGNAGSIDITAKDSISIDGETSRNSLSAVANTVQSGALGDAGGITVDTASLSVTNGATINSSTLGEGNAGSVNIASEDTIVLNGKSSQDFRSSIVSAVRPEGLGDAGKLSITANSLSLNDAIIDTITTSGQGGIINLQIAEDITLENNSLISARAINTANGGNLAIDAKFIVATPDGNNDLVANAAQGTGGNINIVSAGVFGFEERSSTSDNNTNDIDASSDLGIDGSVNVNTTNDFLNSFELIIPEFVVAEKALQGSCFARRNSQQGSFVYGGTGGLPANPDSAVDEEPSLSSRLPDIRSNPQVSNPSDVNFADAVIRSAPTTQKWQIGDPIVEPTNLVKTADGRSLWVNQEASRNSLVCQ